MSEPFEQARPPFGNANKTASLFVPVLILGLVLLAWFAFQAMQFRSEREAMQATIAVQETPIAESKKMRDSLDAIAQGTAKLADSGNPNARLIVDELRRRGITISQTKPMGPDGTPPQPPK